METNRLGSYAGTAEKRDKRGRRCPMAARKTWLPVLGVVATVGLTACGTGSPQSIGGHPSNQHLGGLSSASSTTTSIITTTTAAPIPSTTTQPTTAIIPTSKIDCQNSAAPNGLCPPDTPSGCVASGGANVPSLLGMTSAQVAAALAEDDNPGAALPYSAPNSDATVAQQYPAPGNCADHNTFALVWTTPQAMATVPDLIGQPQDNANNALIEQGLDGAPTCETAPPYTPPSGFGVVQSQSPSAGTPVPQGSTVDYVVMGHPGC